MRFKKPCLRCEKIFTPETKFSKCCVKCRREALQEVFRKRKEKKKKLTPIEAYGFPPRGLTEKYEKKKK